MSVGVTIDVSGLNESAATVQAMRSALADRRPLHAEMAGNALEFTRAYLRGLNRHRTAERLGARPTRHYERAATAIQGESDNAGAILRIPRRTGLGRAFGFVLLRPTGGRRFLTIPAGPETYGRQAGEWSRETFDFAVIHTHRGPSPVLVWAADGGTHRKGDVAFWLRTLVYQKQDPTLLPSDAAYQELGRRTITSYFQRALTGYDGPYGGTSTGMPSA